MTSTTNSALDHIMASLRNKHTLRIEDDIEKYIKAEAYKHQLRIKDFFEDYDKLRKSYITEDKFRSGLSNFKLHLSEDNIQALLSRYRRPDNLIDYVSFCESVEHQFYDRDLALENLNAVKSKSIYEDHEAVLLTNIINYLRNEIRTRRILIKPSLQDFDRINTCHVTFEQFTRALTKLGLNLPDICFKVLARKYMDKNITREVNYVKFLEDVDPVSSSCQLDYSARIGQGEAIPTPSKGDATPAFGSREEVSGTQSGLRPLAGAGAGAKGRNQGDKGFITSSKEESRPEFGDSQIRRLKDVEDLEKMIKAEVVMRKLRIHEFFRDFDKLRKGYMHPDNFKRTLQLTGIKLSEEQMDMLVQKYARPEDGQVQHKLFCDNIREIFTHKGIQRDPLFEVAQVTSATTIPARRYHMHLSPEEAGKLEHLLGLVRREICTRRLLLKPHFQDFDLTQNGYVTRSQFLRVLYQFDVYPNDDYINVLLKCYTDNGNLNEINYYDFCRDVDGQDSYTKNLNLNHSEQFSLPPGPAKAEPYIYKDGNSSIQDVMTKIQRKVQEERIRVHEFLRDFDRLRSGGVSQAQFRIGLNMAKLPLSNQEFNQLVRFFEVPNKPGYVRWRDFTDAIDEVFTVKGLEMDRSRTGTQLQSLTVAPRDRMTSEQLGWAKKVMDRFAHFSQATRLYIKQFFQDWDRLGRNKVSPKQFRQALATVKFDMTELEFKAVSQYFATEDGYVNYVDFIKATSPEGQQQQQSQIPMRGMALTSSNVLAGNNALGQTYTQTQGEGLGQNSINFESQVPVEETRSIPVSRRTVAKDRLQEFSGSTAGLINYSYIPDLDVDPTKILERIKRDVKVSRTRLREYLQDFDPLRKGLITINKFLGSLDKLKIKLMPNEAEALKRLYVDHDDDQKRVEYLRFASDVDRVFVTKGLQRNPTHKVQQYSVPEFLNPKDLLNQQEEQQLHQFLTQIGEHVRINRILIKPFFKDKDTARSGKVSFPRFRSILDQCNVPLTDEGYSLLCKRFSHQGVEFNYVEFDEVLKKYSDDGFYQLNNQFLFGSDT